MVCEYEMVSVIVPVYNGEKYLRQCMDSILRQSCNNMEIICIDDGSTDGSHETLKEYEEKEERVHVIFQHNCGVSAARNTGIRHAKGKYVTFIDCDDYIDENYIENLLCHIEDNDIVMTGFIDEKGHQSRKSNIFPHNFVLIFDNDSREKFMTDVVSKRTFSFFNARRDIGFCIGKLYALSLIKKNNIQFDENIRLYEDLYFFLNCLLYASGIEYFHSEENAWYHYVFRIDSSLNRKDYFRYKEQEKYIEKVYAFSLRMENRGINTMHFKQAIYAATVKMLASDFKQFFYERDCLVEIYTQRTIVNQILVSKTWSKAIQSIKMKNIRREAGAKYLIFFVLCCRYQNTWLLELFVRIYKFIDSDIRRRKKPEFRLSQCKRILVIAAGAWGDTTMMIPFFKLLRQQCGDAAIMSLCTTKIAGENLSQFNLIDDISHIPKEIAGGINMLSHPWAVKKFTNKINAYHKFDIAICLTPSIGMSILLHQIKAKTYAGYCRLKRKEFFDYSVDWNEKSHYVDKYLCILEKMGCFVQDEQRVPQLDITSENLQSGNAFVSENKLDDKYIIGIGIGASSKARKWGSFGQLIADLNKITDIAVLLFGGTEDAEEISDIIANTQYKKRIFRISCEIGKLRNYICICNLIIGNDSGFSHFGAACGVDTIQIRGCVKGSTAGARGSGKIIIVENENLECRGEQESVCAKGTYECLTCTTVDQVENIIWKLRSEQEKGKF